MTADPMLIEQLYVQLTSITQMDRAKWDRILSEPPNIQADLLQEYKDQDWTKPGASAGQIVLAILSAIGQIGGVAGAVSAVVALKSL